MIINKSQLERASDEELETMLKIFINLAKKARAEAEFKLSKDQDLIDMIAEEIESRKEPCKHEKIEYDSTYEMRSKDMYCVKCGKCGSREELQPREED